MTLSIIISARKNSKFISKLIFSLLMKAENPAQLDISVLINKHDTWNKDFYDFLRTSGKVKLVEEDLKYGRAGLHKYFEMLLPYTTGEWILYLCDDHDVILEHYDKFIIDYIKFHALDGKKIYQIIPQCSNTGSVIHILSRGWIDTTKGIGKHPNVDSYLNDVAHKIPGHRLYYPQKPIFVDYTAMPEIMSPEQCRTEIDPTFPVRNYITDPTVQQDVAADAQLLIEAIGKGL